MLKAIFFDLDDTLIWDQKSIKDAFFATCKLAEERYKINVNKLEEAVRDSARRLYSSYETFSFTKQIGINPFEGLWGNFLDEHENFLKLKEIAPNYRKEAWSLGLKKLGVDDPDFGFELGERFQLERRKRPYLYEDTIHVLEALKENYQLLLLTNGSPDLQITKLKLSPELLNYFEHIVISGDFGKGKPEPAIFAHALSLLSLHKDEVIMVGDNLKTDILGANLAGIRSVWLNREGKERSDEIIPMYEIKQLEELKNFLMKL